jgi:hypothetical protein
VGQVLIFYYLNIKVPWPAKTCIYSNWINDLGQKIGLHLIKMY